MDAAREGTQCDVTHGDTHTSAQGGLRTTPKQGSSCRCSSRTRNTSDPIHGFRTTRCMMDHTDDMFTAAGDTAQPTQLCPQNAQPNQTTFATERTISEPLEWQCRPKDAAPPIPGTAEISSMLPSHLREMVSLKACAREAPPPARLRAAGSYLKGAVKLGLPHHLHFAAPPQ